MGFLVYSTKPKSLNNQKIRTNIEPEKPISYELAFQKEDKLMTL